MVSWQAGAGVQPYVIAHRGAAAFRPENTLAAFSAAIEAGADGVECDVHATADGKAVVIHDATVARSTNGNGSVGRMSASQVQALDAGGGERVPLLEDVVDLCRGRALLCVEMKRTQSVPASVRALRAVNSAEVSLCSFKPGALNACRELLPNLKSFFITGSVNPNPLARWREAFPLGTIRRTGARGLSCHHRMLSPGLVSRIRADGLALVVWSFVCEEQPRPKWYEKALAFEPDALVTIWPRKLRRVITRRVAV